MSSRRRAIELAGFCLLVVLSLGLLAWRWSGQRNGLSAEQAESLVLARSFLAGEGLRLTPASSPLAGPPNLVWLFVQAGVLAAQADVGLWLPRLSLLCLALSLVLVSLRSALVWRRPVRVEDALPALGLSLTTALAEAAGLGSGSVVWVLSLAVVAVLVGRWLPTGNAAGAGFLMGALCLLRPSAVWLLAASVPAWWLAAHVEGRRAWREALSFLVAGTFAAGLVFGGRLLLLGELPVEGLLPSSAGAEATREFLERQSRWFLAALAALLVACTWRRFHMRGGATLLAWVLMTVVLANWTENPRSLFLGCVPLLAMAIGDGLSAAREALLDTAQERPLRWLAATAVGAMGVMLLLATIASYVLGPIMQHAVAATPRPELVAELKGRGLREPLIAWADAAEAAALFPEARVVVVHALSPRVEDLLVSEGPPDVVDARIPVESMPRLAALLRPGPGGAWWLAEQSPDDDPRCPEGRLALVSMSGADLVVQLQRDVEEEQLARALSRWRCALAALGREQLPAADQRRALGDAVAARSQIFEQQGRLELAVRSAALAASLTGEEVQLRARAERLRRRLFAQ